MAIGADNDEGQWATITGQQFLEDLETLSVPDPKGVDALCAELGWSEEQSNKMKTSLGQFLAKDSMALSARDLGLLSFELDVWRFVGSRVVAQTPADGDELDENDHESIQKHHSQGSVQSIGPGVARSVLDSIQNVDCVRAELVKLDYQIPSEAVDREEHLRRLRALPIITRKLKLPWDIAHVNEHQDGKDIGRDEITFNGNFYRGADLSYGGIVEKVSGLVSDDVAKILLSCLNRTFSGGEAFADLHQLVSHDSVLIVPDSASAKPLELSIFTSADNSPEYATGMASTVYDIRCAENADKVLATCEAFFTFTVTQKHLVGAGEAEALEGIIYLQFSLRDDLVNEDVNNIEKKNDGDEIDTTTSKPVSREHTDKVVAEFDSLLFRNAPQSGGSPPASSSHHLAPPAGAATSSQTNENNQAPPQLQPAAPQLQAMPIPDSAPAPQNEQNNNRAPPLQQQEQQEGGGFGGLDLA